MEDTTMETAMTTPQHPKNTKKIDSNDEREEQTIVKVNGENANDNNNELLKIIETRSLKEGVPPPSTSPPTKSVVIEKGAWQEEKFNQETEQMAMIGGELLSNEATKPTTRTKEEATVFVLQQQPLQPPPTTTMKNTHLLKNTPNNCRKTNMNDELPSTSLSSALAPPPPPPPPSTSSSSSSSSLISRQQGPNMNVTNHAFAVPAARAPRTRATTPQTNIVKYKTKNDRVAEIDIVVTAEDNADEEVAVVCNTVSNNTSAGGNGTGSSGGCGNSNNNNNSGVTLNIKTSLSMTSLPPNDEQQQESRDVIKAKLRVERPYNSLKKNVDRNIGFNTSFYSSKQHQHRYSWGSGQSSSSLHSSATTGIGSGKDDLWAAIQTDYNYIMDTNLLDTCKEARCELEGAASVEYRHGIPWSAVQKNVETKRTTSSYEDPRELRKWLRSMEQQLDNAPSLKQAMRLNITELQRHLVNFSLLYQEIGAHTRVVNSCIRIATERQQQALHGLLQAPPLAGFDSLTAEQNASSLSSTDETVSTTTTTAPAAEEATTAVTATTGTTSSSVLSGENSQSSGIGTATGGEVKSLQEDKETAAFACSTPKSLATSDAKATTATTSSGDSSCASSSYPKDEGNLEDLLKRYHLVYLKALEVHLWLDSLLRKKTSAGVSLNDEDGVDGELDRDDYSSECCDDIGNATEDDLQDVASELDSDFTRTHSDLDEFDREEVEEENEHGICGAGAVERDYTPTATLRTAAAATTTTATAECCNEKQTDCADGDDEGEEEDYQNNSTNYQRNWLQSIARIGHHRQHQLLAASQQRAGGKFVAHFGRTTSAGSSASHRAINGGSCIDDCEADSESSDLEVVIVNGGIIACRNSKSNSDLRHQRWRHGYALSTTTPQPQSLPCHLTTQLKVANVVAFEAPIQVFSPGHSNNNNSNKMVADNCNDSPALAEAALRRRRGIVAAAKSTHDVDIITPIEGAMDGRLWVAASPSIQDEVDCHGQHQQRGSTHHTVTSTAITTSATTTTTTSAATQTHTSGMIGVVGVGGQKLQVLHGSGSSSASAMRNNNNRVKTIAVVSPNTHNNNGNGGHHNGGYHHGVRNGSPTKSPTVLRKRLQQQQQRHIDISKFNRSNRKSKNCATFYFRHEDPDNDETTSTNYDGCSTGCAEGDRDMDVGISSSTSHTSDFIKSGEASTDEDDGGWMYSSTSAAIEQQQQQQQQQQQTNAADETIIDTITATEATTNTLHTVCTGIVRGNLQSTSIIATSSVVVAAATSTIISGTDDSDKENQRQRIQTGAGTTTHCIGNNIDGLSDTALNSTQIAVTEIALGSGSGSGANEGEGKLGIVNGHGDSSISSSWSSSSLNDREAVVSEATTSAATQITRMPHGRQPEVMSLGRARRAGLPNYNAVTSSSSSYNNNNNNNKNNDSCSNGDSLSSDYAKNNNNNNNIIKNGTPPNDCAAENANGNAQKDTIRYSTRADICNISVKSSTSQELPGKNLPPRSPSKSNTSMRSQGSRSKSSKGKVSHESIKQLVLEAEHLVRDEALLKTPSRPQLQQQRPKHSLVKISSTVRKREIIMSGPIKQRVQEWLEHQPSRASGNSLTNEYVTGSNSNNNSNNNINSNNNSNGNARMDDCEASGEASETDSIPQPGSDTSEGFTDSIATCMQTSTTSYGNSTELIGGSAEPIGSSGGSGRIGGSANAHVGVVVPGYGSSNQSLNAKIVKRSQLNRRKSERPWSVSCLSQLTTESAHTTSVVATNVVGVQPGGLATHSISESALDSLSPSRPRASSSSTSQIAAATKCYDQKGSLKRRRTRKKKYSQTSTTSTTVATRSVGKKTDSGSEEPTGETPKLTQTLLMKTCETMTAQQIQEITNALLSLQKNAAAEILPMTVQQQQQVYSVKSQSQLTRDSDEEAQLMKPNFRVGSVATSFMRNEERLGSLAALATYMNDENEEQGEGTDDHHSSFSETAWDNYQEKYNSENYSEGFDSDAARRLMEFGDDYRNFLDSQSDCCSSLSAANNLDSLSPPRMDSLQPNETKIITQETIASSVDHVRRRRALELEYERRRKTLEVRRKSCQDSSDNQNSPRSSSIPLSASASALAAKGGSLKTDSVNRKLEFNSMSHSAQSLRRTSESDTSTRRRKVDERRRSSRNLEKSMKKPVTSSSSGDDSDEEKEIRNLLKQSHTRLDDTRALKIRCHLLRPEDYTEIINTCRDNIHCLNAVLRGPPGSVLSTPCVAQTKDLLAAWEDLLGWSENAAAARKMQEEMIILKHTLNRLGNKATYELLDTEPSIQLAIEALKSEKIQLQAYRKNMLGLNASVHSWLSKQEQRLERALAEQQVKQQYQGEENNQEKGDKITTGTQSEHQEEQQISTKSENTAKPTYSEVLAGTAEVVWDLGTLMTSEQEFHKHLKDEVGDVYNAWDEADARIQSQLQVLTDSLIAWRLLESGLLEFQQTLGEDRGTLKGLEGALDRGQATPMELAQNVKLVAKLLSEKVNVSQEQLTAVQQHLDPNHVLHIANFTASSGSLSDSGISDGGATSDGGLSERERRLGVLRRLAKQLESALAPGSNAMKSIAARMESAEAELKNLQNTCRDLIVRTAASHQNKKQQQQQRERGVAAIDEQIKSEPKESAKCNGNGFITANGHASGKKAIAENSKQQYARRTTTNANHNVKRRQRKNSSDSSNSIGDSTDAAAAVLATSNDEVKSLTSRKMAKGLLSSPDSGDPYDDPSLSSDVEALDDDNRTPKKGWGWRIARAAVPVQLALITIYCAACFMQPNCCDNLNNMSMSFTPQLRYIRGPPPI